MKDKKIAYIVPIFLFILSIFITYLSSSRIFDFQPITTDENSYVFETKLLLKGKFYTASHLLKEFFLAEQIISDGKWFSKYSPGHSLILIPGVLLNFNNLMPIILSSFMVVIIYLFLLKLTKNIIISVIAGIITISSPLFIIISGTYLSHTSCSFFIVMYLFVFYKNTENNLKNTGLSFLLGFIWSFIFIIRQYACLLVTAPFVIYHLYLCIRHKEYRNFFFFILGTTPLILLLFLYNYKCTGNPFMHTFLYYDPEEKIGFGLKFQGKYLFTPDTALENLKYDIKWLNKWILGLPFSLSLILISILFSKNNIWKILFTLSILLVILGQFFYYCPGLYWFIPNYHYEILPISIILLFMNINFFYKVIKKIFTIYIIAIILIPFYIFYYPVFFKNISQYFHQRAKELVSFKDIIKNNDIHNAIIFVRIAPQVISPATIFINNSPFLDNDILTVNDLGYSDYLLMSLYPERKFYRLYFTGEKHKSSILEMFMQKSFCLTMKFDNSFYTNTGKWIPMPNSDKRIIYGRKGIDKPDTLLYGPYQWFPTGKYRCIFYIKVNRIGNNDPIAKIDICTDSGSKIFDEKILIKSDFCNNNTYYKFDLNFTLDNMTEIETRVYFYSNADVLVRKIKLLCNIY